MYIALRKTLERIERCLPEGGAPTRKQLCQMYDRVLRLRSQLLSVIYAQETFGATGRQERERIAERLSAGASDGAAVTLTFEEPLPAAKELTAAVEGHWLDLMQAATRKARQEKPLPYFEKAFVQIKIITPRGADNTKVWDASNRAVNVIINNLKGVFFHDEDMEHMAFSVVGSWGEQGVTIIRVSAFDESRQIGPSDFKQGQAETMGF